MKKLVLPLLTGLIILTSAAVSINATSLAIEDDFSIEFKSKDPTGNFTELNGTVNFDPNDLKGSSFDLTIPVNSISTGNNMKDKKSQTSEWFNESKFPNIEYKSTSVVKVEDGYVVTGNLTIKGVKKAQNVPLNVKETDNGYLFSGKFWVNRIKYGVGKKSPAVPDVMTINYSLPVSK